MMLKKSPINHLIAFLSVSVSQTFGHGIILGFTLAYWITNLQLVCIIPQILIDNISCLRREMLLGDWVIGTRGGGSTEKV